ncbi:flagellar hook-length control protein FliK [Sphingomonas sp. RT2P30]|uniref:flagellar hook-length control protein FliK n=1 Tax=Parasphingomonas halimpatiens TaxID=3096162 RepID=UPI002FC89D49
MNFAVTGMTIAPQPPAGSVNAAANVAADFTVAMDVALSAGGPAVIATTTDTAARGLSAAPSQANASRLFAKGAGIAFGPSPNMLASVATFQPAIVSMAGATDRLNVRSATAAGYYSPVRGLDAAAVGSTVGAVTIAAATGASPQMTTSEATADMRAPAPADIVNRPLPPDATLDVAVINPMGADMHEAAMPSLPVAMSSATSIRPAAKGVVAVTDSLRAAPVYDAAPAGPAIATAIAMRAPVRPAADATAIDPGADLAKAIIVTSPVPGPSAPDATTTVVATAVSLPRQMVASGLSNRQQTPDVATASKRQQPSDIAPQATVVRSSMDGLATIASPAPLVAESGTSDPQLVSDVIAVPSNPQRSLVASNAKSAHANGEAAAAIALQSPAAIAFGARDVRPISEAGTVPTKPDPSLAASPRTIEREPAQDEAAVPVEGRAPATSSPLIPASTVDAASNRSPAPPPLTASDAVSEPPLADVPTALAPSPLPPPGRNASEDSVSNAVGEASPPAEAPRPIAAASPDPSDTSAAATRSPDRPGGASPHIASTESARLSITEPLPIAANGVATDGAVLSASTADARALSPIASVPSAASTDPIAPSRRTAALKPSAPVAPPARDDMPAVPVALPSVLAVQLVSASAGAPTMPAADRAPAEAATPMPALADKGGDADLARSPTDTATPTLAVASTPTLPLPAPMPNAPQRSAVSAMASVKDGAPRRASNPVPVRRTKAERSAPPALPAPSADAMMATPARPLTIAASEAMTAAEDRRPQSPTVKAERSAPSALPAPSADAMMATPARPLTIAASEGVPAVEDRRPQSPTVAAPFDALAAAPNNAVATVILAPPIIAAGAPHSAATVPRDAERLKTSFSTTLGAGAGIGAVASAPPRPHSVVSPTSDTIAAPAVAPALKPATDGFAPQDVSSAPAIVATAPPPDTSLRPIAGALHRPNDIPVVAARPGQIGHDVGVEIARRISAGGEELVVRLEPAELGRIEVRMSFDDRGGLRAMIAADSPVALDMLRRDSAELSRSLSDAGIRSDAQSLRFQNDGSGSGSGSGNQPRSPWLAADPKSPRQPAGSFGDDLDATPYRPVRTSGRYDLLA